MALNATCEKGHRYVQADIYQGWPDGAPYCPICFLEWAKGKENDYPITHYMRAEAQKAIEETERTNRRAEQWEAARLANVCSMCGELIPLDQTYHIDKWRFHQACYARMLGDIQEWIGGDR